MTAAGVNNVVQPEADSRLEALVAQYDQAYAASKAATDALKTITDGIKAELAKAAPDQTSIDLTSPLLAKPLRMSAVTSWRIDAKKLKAEQPALYVTYAVQSTAWKLAAVGSAS